MTDNIAAHYFPEVPRETVRANLVSMLNTTDQQLDAELARFGQELKLRAAINPEIRSRIAVAVAASRRERSRGESASAGAALGRTSRPPRRMR